MALLESWSLRRCGYGGLLYDSRHIWLCRMEIWQEAQPEGERRTSDYLYEEVALSPYSSVLPGSLGHHLLYTDNFHQLYSSSARQFHQCPELCGSLGAGTQIYRAVVLLDYCRCRLLLSLYRKRHPFQGRTLRSLRHHRRSRIL